MLVVYLFSATVASGASTHAEVEVLPNSVELLPNGQETHVLVVLRNTSETNLSAFKLSWLNDETIKISAAEPLDLKGLAPHAETVWTLGFSQAGLDPVAGSVRIRIDYQDGGIPKVIAQSLPVKSREPVLIDKYLDAKIETTLETLDSYHPGKIDLLLTNKLGRKVVLNIGVSGPDFILFALNPKDCKDESNAGAKVTDGRRAQRTERCNIEVGAYQTHAEVFDVGVKERVEPGKYLLTFGIAISPNETQSTAQSMVKSQVVEVGVLGESAILKLLGVPSFLLLPGSLLLLTLSLLSKYGPWKSTAEKGIAVIEPGSAHFWLLSITLSGLMAAAFHIIFHSWYFVRYGLADLVYVWLVSVLLGAAIYAAVRWVQLQHIPTEKDEPADVLRRLSWQRKGLKLDRYTIKDQKDSGSVFGIRKVPQDDKRIWISPAIKVSMSELSNQADNAKKYIRDDKPGRLAKLLRNTPRSASWSTKPIDGPKLLQLDKLKEEERDTIVEEDG